MGRRHGNGRAQQRSHLIADREVRSKRANLAFTLFRPTTEETSQEIYARLRALQQEEDIPEQVKLFVDGHHSSLLQERRMRKGLVMGFAAGFAVHTALGHVESGLPDHGRGRLTAQVTSVNVIGRNRNVIMANVADPDEILTRSRQAVRHILGDMGLTMNIDRADHVTLGTCNGGLTQTESRHVAHVAQEVLFDLPLELDPVVIQLNGRRVPLSEARDQLAS